MKLHIENLNITFKNQPPAGLIAALAQPIQRDLFWGAA